MVGRFQAASIQVDRDESGEAVLMVFGRGGGGNFRRDDHEFVRGAWRVVRSSRFENGKISEIALRPGASGSLPDPPLERQERPNRRSHPQADPPRPDGRAQEPELGTPAAQSDTPGAGGVAAAWLLAAVVILIVAWLLRRVPRATESD
jgi:hypothetical protein